MDLPTPQQQHMVMYYMLNRSQKRMYLQDSFAANPVLHRFLHNSRNPSVKRSGQLDYSEVNEAELCLIKNLQASAFQEIEFLAKSSCNSKKGKLFSLNPFLDGNQILRVGGRLSLSRITKPVPGTDGKVRVVEIKTNKGNIKRSIGKVCVLPLDN
ncbi:hypothetical protein TNCV_4435821 [Trichonephila clavipes]|nr:hypothetical protein TNCV_4435821 [Trichonephila clavipes]